MKRRVLITWLLLLLLTIFSAIISCYYNNSKFLTVSIMLLAALKFIGIAFNFMELKKAHVFWKISILAFLFLFTIVIFLL